MPRNQLIPLALVIAGPALASEPQFPQEGDRFLLDVRGPAVGGQARFARVVGEPDARSGWATRVVCGSVDVRTGRERIELRADGVAGRSRGGWLGGTYRDAASPTGTSGFAVTAQNGLDVELAMPAPCATGKGQVSSGD